MLIPFVNVLGLNKSQLVNFPRQRYSKSDGLEVTLSTLRRSKSASGCSKSPTSEEGDRGNLDEQSKTRQGILVIFIAIVVAMPTIMKNCHLNLLIIIPSPSNNLSPHHINI